MRHRLLSGLTLIILSAVTARADVLTGPVINPDNGHSYYLLDNANWITAETQAEALGGYLVTINNAAENDFVFNTFNGYNNGNLLLWIGLYDPITNDGSGTAHKNNFRWIDGTPMGYTNWELNEPNNSGGHEQYGMLINRGGTAPSQLPGLWNDAPLDLHTWTGNPPIYGVVEVVPEPASLLMLGVGCGVLAMRRRRATRCA